MEWSSLISTLVGATIAIASALAIERSRWRRDHVARALEVRRAAYEDFLRALSQSGEAIRAVALGDYSPSESRGAAVREAFRKAELYAARERLELIGTAPVIAAAVEAFRDHRRLRDLYVAGMVPDSAEYRQFMDSREVSPRQILRAAMRQDLGLTSETPDAALRP